MNISPSGLYNVIYRTAQTFNPYYNRIQNRIAKSSYVRSNEITYSYNGLKYWLWDLSNQKDSLVLIRESKGSKVH